MKAYIFMYVQYIQVNVTYILCTYKLIILVSFQLSKRNGKFYNLNNSHTNLCTLIHCTGSVSLSNSRKLSGKTRVYTFILLLNKKFIIRVFKE
jgi:hypothetical protein